MDVLLKALVYLAMGLLLLAANLWFFRSVKDGLAAPTYIIQPFVVIGSDGRELNDKVGQALARMTVARLAGVQDTLREAHDGGTSVHAPGEKQDSPFSVTQLFVPRPVDIPANLFEPVEIEANVAGVELGGFLPLVNRFVTSNRGIRFTVYQQGDRALISGELGKFTTRARTLWLQSGTGPEEIANTIAYALVWLKLRESESARANDMDVQQFRQLLETIARVDRLNEQAARGYVVEKEFVKLLAPVEESVKNAPTWAEMLFLAGSIADGAANRAKAQTYYGALLALNDRDRAGASKAIFETAKVRLRQLAGPSEQGAPLGSDQAAFVLAASEFARRMSLAGENPRIIFKAMDQPGLQAVWNDEMKRYEVNTETQQVAGLPQYVALMGRFMQRNYDRCFAQRDEAAQPPFEFWNSFRHSVVDYLIQSEPSFNGVTTASQNEALFRALKQMEQGGGGAATQRLALSLLEGYECDWRAAMLPDIMVSINRERGLMDEAVVRKAAQTLVPASG